MNAGRGFHVDDPFSFHKDLLLKFLWRKKSFEGRFVLVKDKHLQKHCGIDVILQGKDDESDILLDNKHRRGDPIGFYGDVLLEELSNSIPGWEKAGWALDSDKRTDLVFYCCWLGCDKCFKSCMDCNLSLNVDVWLFPYKIMREWFKDNYTRFQIRYNTQMNKTKNRCIPIEIAKKCFGMDFVGRFETPPFKKINWSSVLGEYSGQISIDNYILSGGE